MAEITVEELRRFRQNNGVDSATAGGNLTPDTASRLSSVPMVDREVEPDQPVRHKNALLFLGDKLMTSKYRQEMQSRTAAPGIYSPQETGVVDKLGEFVRNTGYNWYQKTDTYKKQEAERRKETQEGPEEDIPDTILGNMGYGQKDVELSPFADKLSKTFNLDNNSEKRGLDRLLSHNKDAFVEDISKMVALELPAMNMKEPDKVQTLFGEVVYDGVTLSDTIAENLVAIGVANLIAGEKGTPVATEGHEIITNILTEKVGFTREEALDLADTWIVNATAMVAQNANEIGEFTPEDIERAQIISDPRGILMSQTVEDANEVYQSGITYWGARAGAAVERTILAKVGAPFEIEIARRGLLENIPNPVARKATEIFFDTQVMKFASPLSFMDAQALEAMRDLFDPRISPLTKLTPGVQETRAWRSLEAKQKGLGAQVFNEAVEGAFDFAAFLTELFFTRKIIVKAGVDMFSQIAPTDFSTQAYRVSQIATFARNSAFVGVNRAISTPGSLQERAAAGILTALYSFTPAVTGGILDKVGYTASGALVPVLTDFALNSLITTATSYVPEYMREGGFTDQFWTTAMTNVMFDFAMSLSTRAFATPESVAKTQKVRDLRLYETAKDRNNGNAPVNAITGKEMSADEFLTMREEQRDVLSSVKEVFTNWEEMVKEKTTGERLVEGVPDVEVDKTKVYTDSDVRRFRQKGFKAAEARDKAYDRLSNVIDKITELEGAKQTAETIKDLSNLKGQRTRLEKQIDVIEGKGMPVTTPKPAIEVTGEAPKELDKRIGNRLVNLYSEIKTLQKQELAARKAANVALTEGVGAKATEKSLLDIQTKIRKAQVERDAMIYYEGEPGVVTPAELNRAQLESIKKQITQFEAGYKKGQLATKQDIKAFQDYLVQTIKQGEYLTDKQKVSILEKINKIQTEMDFGKALAKLRIQIDYLSKENAKKLYEKACDKFLHKVGKDIERGYFKADTADSFNAAIRARVNVDTDVETFGRSTKELLVYDMNTLNRLDSTPEQIERVFDDLVKVYNLGAASKEWQKLSNEARTNRLVQLALDDITGQKDYVGKELVPEEVRLLKKRPKGWLYQLFVGQRHFPGLITELSAASNSPKGTSPLERFTDMFYAERMREQVVSKGHALEIEAFKNAYGSKDRFDVYDKVTADLADMVKIPLSEDRVVDISRTVARQRWMEWQQPEGEKRLTKKNGYTEATIAEIEKFLTPDDFKFMSETRKIYDYMYKQVNDIFREQKGYDLPYRENYTPFVPTVLDKDFSDANMIDLMHYDARKDPVIDNKSPLKELKGLSQLTAQGDVYLLERYIKDMGHYIGFAKTIADTKSIFSDPRVQGEILKRFGDSTLKAINNHIDTLTRGKLETASNGVFSGINIAATRYAKQVLQASPKRTVVQMLSAMLYITEMPAVDFAKGVLDLPRAWKSGEFAVISKNLYMRERGVRMDRDLRAIAEMAESQDMLFLRKTIDNPRWDNIMNIFIRSGDRGAIYFGAWALYKHYTKTMPGAEALDKTLRFINSSQQSGDLSQMSNIMSSGNPLLRVFTLFKHTTQQYANNYLDAIASKGRISKGQMAKTMAAYHAMSVLYQLAVSAGKITAGTAIASLVSGPLGDGLVFTGDLYKQIIAYITSKVMDEQPPHAMQMFALTRITGDIIDIMNLVQEACKDGPELKTVGEILRKGGEVLGPGIGGAGAAIRYGGDLMRAAGEFYEGEFVRGLLKMLSYSDYQMREYD